MKLNLKDRLIILKTLLPQYDTRQNIILKNSVSGKIQLSPQEESLLMYTNVGNNQYEIGFKTVDAITATIDVSFTEEEQKYLKQRVEFIDGNGMFSAETIDTYDKITNN
ncbi:MAG: hypothetical protein LBJ60_08885 [Tannerellaceae bacterium]|jgi:hypothetical protein|nr:hypothetical protein [Tannerellaceae bacterium]